MNGFDPAEYEERLAQLGRPRKAVAAWTLLMFVAILAMGLGLSMADGETTDCRPRGHMPETTGIDLDTINPTHRNDWVPRIDPNEADEEDADAATGNPGPAPAPADSLHVRC